MNRIAAACLLLISVYALSSCHLLRRAAKKTVPATADTNRIVVADTVRPVTPATPADTAVAKTDTAALPESGGRVGVLLEAYAKPLSYTTFSGKARMHYEGGGENRDFKATIRIEKDKQILINISATALGVNVAQLLVRPDSVFLLNLIQHEATVRPVSAMGNLLPLPMDFQMLQHFITGEALRSSGIPMASTHTRDSIFFNIAGDNFSQQLSYSRDDSSLREQQYQTLDTSGFSATLGYSQYGRRQAKPFSELRSANVFSSGNPYYLELEFSEAAFDLPVDINFSVPKRYKRK